MKFFIETILTKSLIGRSCYETCDFPANFYVFRDKKARQSFPDKQKLSELKNGGLVKRTFFETLLSPLRKIQSDYFLHAIP